MSGEAYIGSRYADSSRVDGVDTELDYVSSGLLLAPIWRIRHHSSPGSISVKKTHSVILSSANYSVNFTCKLGNFSLNKGSVG